MLVYNFVYYTIMILFINSTSIFFKMVRGWHCREFVIKIILSNHITHILRIPPSKKHMVWLTAYDESRAIRNVKRGEVSPCTI